MTVTSIPRLVVVATAAIVVSSAPSCYSLSLAHGAAIRRVRSHTTGTSSASTSTSTRLYMSGFSPLEEGMPAFSSRPSTTSSTSTSTNHHHYHKKRGDMAEMSMSAVAITASLESPSLYYDDNDSAKENDYDYDLFQQLVSSSNNYNSNVMQDSVIPVLSTALLITANTVGASCLVLPELAAGPGLGLFTSVAMVTYLINLVSGLVLAEVAIQQYEQSGASASPSSSFKDFADVSFDNSPLISNAIAWVSILTNACILVYTFTKAGTVGSQLLSGIMVDLNPSTASLGFVGLVGIIMTCCSREQLSNLASLCVAGLVVSFCGLLLPAMAVQDPMATILSPGVADMPLVSAGQAFPILLLSLVYQNIVPSVTKILNYDRTKTTASLALGSAIPLAMYLTWCFVSLGNAGLQDATTTAMGGLAITGFTMATIVGSSVGTAMSVAEEFDSLFTTTNSNQQEPPQDAFSLPAVAASMAVPLIAVLALGNGANDMTMALGLAGSIGTPLLYGLVPAIMAYKQHEEESYNNNNNNNNVALVPGGRACLTTLGLASTGMVGHTLLEQVASMAT